MSMQGYIYRIYNIVNSKQYVGSTENITNRWKKHSTDLQQNKHHNIYLQRSYNKHGANNFLFEIIEECDIRDKFELHNIEQRYLDNEPNLYNIGRKASGGDNRTNHPLNNEISLRTSKTIRHNISLLSEEDRKRKFGKLGDKNGMFGKTHTQDVKDAARVRMLKLQEDGIIVSRLGRTNIDLFGEEKAKEASRKLSEYGKTRTGNKNPFYGRHHTEETKQKIRDTKNKIPISERTKNNSQITPVQINGVNYMSLSEAGRQLQISPPMLIYRIRSTKEKYSGYIKAPVAV
jgi:group I intron endonuclease